LTEAATNEPANAGWRKLGLLYSPDGSRAWSRSHAQNPVAQLLGGDRVRVFFATRDAENRSHVAHVELALDGRARVLEPPLKPDLAPGSLGCFDDHGVYPASLVRAPDDRLFMYYIGWNPGVRRPLFYASIGLAVSTDNGASFTRHGQAPIMARSEFDPCFVTSPYVLRESDRWRMWYVSGFRWEETDGAPISYYHIKYAESADGVNWERDGRVCIDLRRGERNIVRPCVIRDESGYRMWYSYAAGAGYHIGYATSADGLEWTRRDEEVGIGRSDDGFDADAIAYPWVFRHADKLYMLYNGGGFGREGFGLAERVQ
jgi:hypothetical protein